VAMHDASHRFTTPTSQPTHPLAVSPKRGIWALVLIGWLAVIGWSPEQVLAVLMVMLPAVADRAEARP